MELILLHFLYTAILNWRAVAYGMRLDITTGLMGSQEQRCSRTVWQMDSGIRLPCHLAHPTFCSTWTAIGKKICSVIYMFLKNAFYLHTGIKLEKEFILNI